MSYYNRKRRSGWGYVIELAIIIIGITVSFIVNEWRESEKAENKKHHLLYDINNDLRTDSILIDRAIKYYQVMIMSHDSLLLDRKKTFSKDSLDIYLDHFVSYYPFNETATTYKRVLSDQDLTIDSEDTLIQHYMNLHSIVYPNLHEWFFIEKDFVLNTALPYMDKNAPFVYPTPKRKSFDGSVFYTLRNDDVFMNYLKSGRLYKESTITSLTRVFAYVKYIKGKTHQYIAEENRKEESNKE